MEGLGNDFVVIDGPVPSGDEIRHWCDRRRGIGADGVLRVTTSHHDGAAIRMQYWNADGSDAAMCGNGLRCVARYGLDHGLTDGKQFGVETAVGINRAEVLEGNLVRVELGRYDVGDTLRIDDVDYVRASVGNHHAVTFVDDPERAPVTTVGPQIEVHESFSEPVNVEFVSVVDSGLRMRVWERGAGETHACGSGAAAAVAVAAHRGLVEPATNVELPGGSLAVELIDGVAWITGPANVAFAGRLP